MAVKCKNCNFVMIGDKGLHMISKCENCGETDRSKFIRVEAQDYSISNHEEDKGWLESHKIIE